MENVNSYVLEKAKNAHEASFILSALSTSEKNSALVKIAEALKNNASAIMAENKKDIEEAKAKGLSNAMIDRLIINEKRINDMIDGIRNVVSLTDPIGEVVKMWRKENDLQIGSVRVPLGVIGIIYEARPNVTVDAASLCLKSGNAVILKGGSEALHSNKIISDIIINAGIDAGLPKGFVEFLDTSDRDAVGYLMQLNEFIDVLIPRGGAGLINYVVKNATVPVIQTGVGNCHIYVDESADFEMARDIIINAKTQRPAVCNAAESILVHKNIASDFLPYIGNALSNAKVEIHGCPVTLEYVPEAVAAEESDWGKEYLDLKISVKVVDSVDAAIKHINKYGTKHSEAIITKDYSNSQKFLKLIDAAAVYVNASTRFTDGGEFGFGAEIGISTQKLHARGPMGLKELTTVKYIIYGDGQIRE